MVLPHLTVTVTPPERGQDDVLRAFHPGQGSDLLLRQPRPRLGEAGLLARRLTFDCRCYLWYTHPYGPPRACPVLPPAAGPDAGPARRQGRHHAPVRDPRGDGPAGSDLAGDRAAGARVQGEAGRVVLKEEQTDQEPGRGVARMVQKGAGALVPSDGGGPGKATSCDLSAPTMI